MKIKKSIKIMLFIVCSIVVLPTFTNAKDYEYTNLDINADILIDWTINVQEIYTANFFIKKHGMFRTIPLNYSVQENKFHIDISDIKVDGKKYTTSRSKWERTIKIWDPDKYEYWKVVYPISYSTYWLIRNFSWMWYAELYWNVVWNKFDTSIWNVSVIINLPKIYTWFKASDFLITADGITKSVKDFKWTVDRSQWNKIVITYDKWLSAYQWITLSVKFPNNYFVFDDKKQSRLAGDSKNWIIWTIKSFFADMSEENFALVFVALCFVPFILITCLKKINRNSSKLKWEFAKKYKVIVQFIPPKWLNSAEVWLLYHRKALIKDMLSLIYKWAAQWLITISAEYDFKLFSKSTYVMINKKSEIPENTPDYEKNFFKAIVRNDENKIDKNTSISCEHHLASLERYGKNMWWFYNKKDNNTILIIYLLLIFIWIPLLGKIHPITCMIMFFLLTIFGAIFFNKKLEETDQWAMLISHILWYKQFLKACDERQLKTFLAQDPLYFDKTLPYAVALWMETEFLEKIEPIMQEMQIKPLLNNLDYGAIYTINNTISSVAMKTYSSDSWFSSWSSFGWGGWWFSGGWWWWGGWWWSW